MTTTPPQLDAAELALIRYRSTRPSQFTARTIRDDYTALLAEVDRLRAELAQRRDQVLTEAADLIRSHRGDLNAETPWWDTRDRDTAAALLLAARTTPDAH